MEMPTMETIETERLTLQLLTPAHYEYLFKHCSKEEAMQYVGWENENDYDVDYKKYTNGGFVTWRSTFLFFLLKDKVSGRLLGRCAYHNYQAMHKRSEIGYDIKKEEDKNKGYMKEALKAILKYGFEELKLNRVEAFIGPHNIPSRRLVEGYGFVIEGQLRQHFCYNDVLQDSVVYALLASEYERLKHSR
ncbi:MAG: GNAT family N-acetyltransferase [Bacteroidetes bacterium]|nr:GNAT family N-acetyltransferase [Bacteroidota bacterium]